MASKCVAELDQSPPPHVVQEPPTNEIAELAIDYDFVEQPDQDYFCPVSLELLVEPHQTSCCGHHISQQAANRLIRERKPCPMCKKDKFSTHEDLYFKRKVRQLKVRCPHKKSGCEWMGEVGDLNHHTTSCPKRPWKCQYCDHESIYEMGPTDHTPNCANYPLPCPNQCEIGTIPRCQADSHLLECPLQLVECEFAGTGCDVKVPQRDLAGHMTENAQHHLMTATLLNLRLTRELHQKMEEKDQQIIELKQQLKEQEIKMITDIKNDLDTKLQQQTRDLDTKRQQQTKDLDTKRQQQTKDLDTKRQQQTRDLDTKLQQQTRDLDTKRQQQTKDLDTKLQQQTKDLDTKRQQQTKDLDTKRQQQTKDLDTKLQQQTKDLDTKFQLQLDTSIQLSTFTCHTHTLAGFNRCQAKGGAGSWVSEPFYNCPGGYKLKLNIDTNGQGEARGTHLTAFLKLLKGDYDTQLHWPQKLTVILDMLNQEDHGHYSVTKVIEFNKAASTSDYKCIGNSTHKFYPLAQLEEKNYLRNNEIKFKLLLKVM